MFSWLSSTELKSFEITRRHYSAQKPDNASGSWKFLDEILPYKNKDILQKTKDNLKKWF
jgi:hypothetical protein